MKHKGEVAKISIQATINEYGGEYGDIEKVFDRIVPFKKKNVQGCFGFIGDDIYIVFPGSKEKADWKDNFRSQPKSIIRGNIKVHTGFYKQWRTVKKVVFDELKKHYKAGITGRVIVVGHSLGGSIATLCSLDIARSQMKKLKLYCLTFGCPRVGNMAFAKLFNMCVPNSIRYVYGADMVASVPLVFQGYWHVKKLVRLAVPWYDVLLFPIVVVVGNPFDHYPQLYKKAIF